MSKADNATTVRLQLPEDQLDWLQSIAERRDMSLDAVVSSLVGVCRNAATASIRRRRKERPSDESEGGPSGGSSEGGDSSKSTDADSALDRLRKARSDVESAGGTPTPDPSDRSGTGARGGKQPPADQASTSSGGEADEESFFDMVTSGARTLADDPDEDAA